MSELYPILSIDAFSLQLSLFEVTASGFRLVHSEGKIFDEPQIVGEMGSQAWANVSQLKDNLRALLSARGHSRFRPGELYAVFADSQIRTTLLTLDGLTENNSELSYLRFRIQKKLKEELHQEPLFDFQPLKQNGSQVTFVVHSVPGAFLNELKEVLEDLGWVLNSASPASAQLYNVIGLEGSEPPLAIVIDGGFEVTTVSFFRQGILDYSRVIEVAGQHMSEGISELEKLTLAEGRKFLFERRYLPGNAEETLDCFGSMGQVSRIFGNWFRELTLTLKFYEEHFPQSAERRIFLTGVLSRVPNVIPLLSRLIGSPVMSLLPSSTLCGLFDSKHDLSMDIYAFGRAVGLNS